MAPPGKTSEPKEPADEVKMSFGDHLDELRRRVIYALLGLGVCIAGCMFFAEDVVAFLCQPLVLALRMAGLPPQLYQEKVPQLFINYMQMAVLAGAILGSPWVIYQIWLFVAAGLYQREKAAVKKFAGVSLALFLLGAAFVYFLVMPFALRYFVQFSQDFKPPNPQFMTPVQRLLYQEELKAREHEPISQPPPLKIPRLTEPPKYDPASPAQLWIDKDTEDLRFYDSGGDVRSVQTQGKKRSLVTPWFNLDDYLEFLIWMMLMFGIAFQMPLVILFLAATEIIPTQSFRNNRRVVIMAITILAAFLCPSPDVVSMMLLATPMWGLFELGLLMGRRNEHRREDARKKFMGESQPGPAAERKISSVEPAKPAEPPSEAPPTGSPPVESPGETVAKAGQESPPQADASTDLTPSSSAGSSPKEAPTEPPAEDQPT